MPLIPDITRNVAKPPPLDAGARSKLVEQRVAENARIPEQPTHKARSAWSVAREHTMSVTLGTTVGASALLLSNQLIVPRTMGKWGFRAAIAGPLLLGAATVATFSFLQPKKEVNPATPLDYPSAMVIPGHVDGDLSKRNTTVATVRGFADMGGVASVPLTLGEQVGRIAGYTTVNEAAAGIAGIGNVALLNTGGAIKAYSILAGHASKILAADRPEITGSSPSLVGVVRNGTELFIAAPDSPTFSFAGAIPEIDDESLIRLQQIQTGTVPKPKFAPKAKIGKFDIMGQENVPIYTDEIVGSLIGYSAVKDAISVMMGTPGDQVVFRGDTSRYQVLTIGSHREIKGRLRGIRDLSQRVVALEYNDKIYARSQGRAAKASFRGKPT